MVDDTHGPDAEWMTSAMLKAYAHPLRRRILRLFSRSDHLRATDIAATLDVPANSVSFHLRTLADAGLIAEAPEHARDRRDRVWTSTKAALNVGGPENPVADEALGATVLAGIVDEHRALLERVAAWAPEYLAGRTAEVHGTFTQRTIRLTDAEFEAAMDAFNDVLNAAQENHDPADPAGRHWQIDLVAADDTI